MNVSPTSPWRFLYACSWLILAIWTDDTRVAGATALEWTPFPAHRIAPIKPITASEPGFTSVPAEKAGISFQNTLSNQRSLERRGLLSGSGVAAGDIDGDGWCDLYFCGLDTSNHLYRNLGGWRFEKVTPTGGIDCPNTDSTAAAFADIDGDQDLDLIVTASGNGTRLFLNNSNGTFRETTHEAGLSSQLGSMSMALADIDGDQDLDLYVANFRPTTIMDEASTRFSGRNINGVPTVTHVNGQPTTLPIYTNRFIISPSKKILELGQADQLFLNNGDGTFTHRPFTTGMFFDESGQALTSPPRDWGLAVQMRDFTGDGAPDIYVCNDLYTPDRIWINRGDGSFKAMPTLALRNTSTFSMGSDFADIDRDGDMDFFVVDMLSPDHRKRHVQVNMSPPRPNEVGPNSVRQQILRNTLQLNLGDNTYAEISQFSGLEATDWSWGPIFLDVDLDGFEDVLVTNGQLRDFQNVDQARRLETIRQGRKVSITEFRKLIDEYPNLATPNFAYRNLGNLRFEDVSQSWGFDQNGISQGMALADLDNDGDLDVIQNNLRQLPTLLQNNASAPRIRVQLTGLSPNTQGVGAIIEVTGGSVPQSQEILCAGRYLSSDQALRTFAASQELTIKVTWRSGKVTSVSGIPPNSLCDLFETAAAPPQAPEADSKQSAEIRFKDVSAQLNHSHKDEPFNDMERQPLLPKRLSQWGPPIAWTDLDLDGWDDLIIGAGRGGALGAYKNVSGQRFEPITKRITRIPSSRDHTSILPWPGIEPAFLIGLSNYEDGVVSGDAISLVNWPQDKVQSIVDAKSFSFGCIASSDFDRDGDLDLFVSGRIQPGRYPQPADSFFFENDQGKLRLAHTFSNLGMVTGVVFSDIDGNGSPELIVGREWASLRVFTGSFQSIADVTEAWHLDRLEGWWNGLSAGDFNGDGKMDLVATNWGHNHKYLLTASQPLKLYHGDFDRNGIWDLVEAYTHPQTNDELPIRSLRTVGFAIPGIRRQTPTFHDYAHGDLETIYGQFLQEAQSLTANHLGHTVFLNQGDHFVASLLPPLSQMSPAFGIAVADFDSDGHEDLFLSQNFFATNRGTHRYDAGRGIILRGTGRGDFAPIPPHESGITIYGEQRAAAISDINHDGRPDLAVSQNGAQTRVYINESPRKGLRVTLRGSPGNPAAIGAQLRMEQPAGAGPVREIHSQAGWLSSDSPTQILSLRHEGPSQLWVRWPDGHETRTKITPGTQSVSINTTGQIIP